MNVPGCEMTTPVVNVLGCEMTTPVANVPGCEMTTPVANVPGVRIGRWRLLKTHTLIVDGFKSL